MILGVGTGRSGTVTLARVLDGCVGITARHEPEPLLPWVRDTDAYKLRLKELRTEREFADIGFYYLPYVPWFITDAKAKIIATRRDPEETAVSYEAWMGPTRNHWLDHKGVGWELDPLFDPAYPKYDIADRHAAIVRFATEYNREVDRLRRTGNVLVVKMQDLGTIRAQRRIFDFAGIPPGDRCYRHGAHDNRGPATRKPISDKVTLYIGTYRKRRHIEACLRSVERYLTGYDDLVFVDDSGDARHCRWLPKYGTVIALPQVGYTVAMRSLCAHAGGRELFWLEEDFTLTAPVDIAEMREHLYHRPYLAQIALLRQPWYESEKSHGGVLGALRAQGHEVRLVAGLHEQRAWFTGNPGLWRGHVSTLGWPNAAPGQPSEWVQSRRLEELGYRFAYLSGIRCHHHGEHEGHGY